MGAIYSNGRGVISVLEETSGGCHIQSIYVMGNVFLLLFCHKADQHRERVLCSLLIDVRMVNAGIV